MALDARQQTKNLLAAAPIRKQTLEDFISGTGIRTQHQASADTRATAEILAGDEYGGLHLCRVSLRRPRRQLCEKRTSFHRAPLLVGSYYTTTARSRCRLCLTTDEGVSKIGKRGPVGGNYESRSGRCRVGPCGRRMLRQRAGP